MNTFLPSNKFSTLRHYAFPENLLALSKPSSGKDIIVLDPVPIAIALDKCFG